MIVKRYIHLLLKMSVIVIMLMTLVVVYGQDEGEAGVIYNPLNPYGGADPWLTYYEGNYYLTATTWRSEWLMWKSPTLAGLKNAEPVQIYFETDASRCCNFWAPEFYLLDSPDGPRWYFYYTAGTPGTYDNQRTHVLESAGTDPMGPYTYKARIFDPNNDVWAIDGSVLQLDGKLYFLFSGWEGAFQSLYIAPMSNPWTISGKRVLISKPEHPWEAQGSYVNEGPAALYHDDKVFVVFSASACWTPDYKLGMLVYSGGDPLSAESWLKHPEPIFQRADENGVFATGHNGFFKSPDGSEDWLVYHANDSLDGACDGRRSTRVQKIIWNADGLPDFGIPAAAGEAITAPAGDVGIDTLDVMAAVSPVTRLKTLGFVDSYLRHANFIARFDAAVNPLADSQFRIVPGLADPDAVSIESVNFPGFYMRHQQNAIIFSGDDGSDDFAASATWKIVPGLADAEWISFEAYNRPGSYIGRMFGVVALVAVTDSTTDVARADATFLMEE